MAFIEKYRFDRLGVFTYSKQTEVPSGHMSNQLPEKVKKARRSKIMKMQHRIASELNQAMVGRVIPVLLEAYDESKGLYIGRSQWDAPGIDNQVFVRENQEGNPDDFPAAEMAEINWVLVEEAHPYDLFGVAVKAPVKDREAVLQEA